MIAPVVVVQLMLPLLASCHPVLQEDVYETLNVTSEYEVGNYTEDTEELSALQHLREDTYLNFIEAVDTCMGTMTYEEMVKCRPSEDDEISMNIPEQCKCLGRCIMIELHLITINNLIEREKIFEMISLYGPSVEQTQVLLEEIEKCEKTPTKETVCGRPLELAQCFLEATGLSMTSFKDPDQVYGGEYGNGFD